MPWTSFSNPVLFTVHFVGFCALNFIQLVVFGESDSFSFLAASFTICPSFFHEMYKTSPLSRTSLEHFLFSQNLNVFNRMYLFLSQYPFFFFGPIYKLWQSSHNLLLNCIELLQCSPNALCLWRVCRSFSCYCYRMQQDKQLCALLKQLMLHLCSISFIGCQFTQRSNWRCCQINPT